MEKHEEFKAWAVKKGVKINGVSAHKFEGRGLGIAAGKKLQVCEVYPRVFTMCLSSTHNLLTFLLLMLLLILVSLISVFFFGLDLTRAALS